MNALRAEWCDLEESAQDEFLKWLHEEHLPQLQAMPEIAWLGHYKITEKPNLAVVGTTHMRRETEDNVPPGRGFVLLTSAPADFFLKPDAALSALDKNPRLSARRNWREAVFIEEARIDGPLSSQYKRDHKPPPAMQLGNFVTTSPETERVLANYYRMHRFLQVEATSGCIGARKYVSVIGWPKHSIFYEFAEMAPDEVLFEARINASLPDLKWGGIHPLDFVVHAPHAPHAGRLIWPVG